MLKDLMQAGGDANKKDGAGQTPKQLAALRGRGEVRILYGSAGAPGL